MPKKVWTDEMTAIAAGMKRAGLSNKAIAARLGTTVPAVSGRMQQTGAKRRLDGRGGNRVAPAGRIALSRFVAHDEMEV